MELKSRKVVTVLERCNVDGSRTLYQQRERASDHISTRESRKLIIGNDFVRTEEWVVSDLVLN